MKIEIKIEHPEHGIQTVVTKPADLIKWERLTKSKMTDLVEVRRLEGGETETAIHIGYEDLAVMAYSVFHRTNQTAAKFDAWANDLEMIELAGIQEPEIPKEEPSVDPLPS